MDQRYKNVRLAASGVAWVLGIAALGVVTTASPAGATGTASGTGTVVGLGAADAVANSFIVVFKDSGVASAAVATSSTKLARKYGATVKQTYSASIRGFAAQMTVQQAKNLAKDPSVALVEQNRTARVSDTQTNPPSWGLDRVDQANLPLSGTYTYPTVSNPVTAYVIDTGVRITHADFQGRASYGYDAVDSSLPAEDCNGHGTHVAGTIAGSTYGIAKTAKIVAVRVLDCSGSGSYAQVIAGVDWVTKNASRPAVANMSLGGGASTVLDMAVDRSIARGITYAVAAGNSNANACYYSPARASTAITVGATTAGDARAYFSNYGACLDIFAPGVSITSTYLSNDTATNTFSGTSMAAPHVAGAAALLLGLNPALTPAKVREALLNGASRNKVTNPGTGSPTDLLRVAADNSAPPPQQCAATTNATDVPIRDLTTINSVITIAGCTGNASSTASVEVHVKHTYRGDLGIVLISPTGSSYPLKAPNPRDGTDNVDVTYPVNLSAAARNGVWTLQIRDYYYGDSGYLDSWTLKL